MLLPMISKTPLLILLRLHACVIGVLALAGSAEAAAPSFSRDILPILSDACFQCHGQDAKGRKADLRLDVEAEAKRKHKDSTPIIPGKSAESDIVKRMLTSDDDDHMPPAKSHKTVTPKQIDLIRQWIDSGAKWGEHWAFTRIEKPRLPVGLRDGGANPIDAFVGAKLAEHGWSFAPLASPETLVRRVSLDLTGLPPTPQETDAFMAEAQGSPSQSARAYERLVDRLLASSRYGERWVWEWLDASRYADSNGYQGDSDRTMWPWRDWVIRAINNNMPYNQFTVWQLAGDLLPGSTTEQKLATGFVRNHMINGEGGRIPEENRIEYLFDQAETVGTVWLGLTMQCTRCHDHKFDPLTQQDTKAVADVDAFETKRYGLPVGPERAKLPAVAKLPGKLMEFIGTLPVAKRTQDNLLECVAQLKKLKDKEHLAQLEKLLNALRTKNSAASNVTKVMVMEERKEGPRDTFILVKGAYDNPTATKAVMTTPGKLPPLPAAAPHNRLGLAQWLVSRNNPLTARVTVNRYWQSLFGVGLVKTAEDFGLQGERPVQMDLLDWLAADFMDHGWDVKRLLKQIVTSRVYRQSSRIELGVENADPENRLLGRGPRFRMPSFMLRDQALAVSGLLSEQLGGPAVKPYQPEGIWEEASFGKIKYTPDTGAKLYRRSLYTFWRRIVGPTMFFDNAPRQFCVVKATRTNTPLQALVTMNETTYIEAARTMAQRVLRDPTLSSDASRCAQLWKLTTCRKPSDREITTLLTTLARLRNQHREDQAAAKNLLSVGDSKRDETLNTVEHAAWTSLCLMVLNLDEVLNKE